MKKLPYDELGSASDVSLRPVPEQKILAASARSYNGAASTTAMKSPHAEDWLGNGIMELYARNVQKGLQDERTSDFKLQRRLQARALHLWNSLTMIASVATNI